MLSAAGLFVGTMLVLAGCFIVFGVVGALRAARPDVFACVVAVWLGAYGLAIASGGVALMLRIAAYV